MKIAYITVKTPFGSGENFILPEMKALIEKNIDLTVFPIRPESYKDYKGTGSIKSRTIYLKKFSPIIVLLSCSHFLRNPFRCSKAIYLTLRGCVSFNVFMKNLTILPRAFAVAHIFKRKKIDHIHAHWGTRTATLAMATSCATGIPWSFTLHRWDIYENNILRDKVKSAVFARCISRKGRDDLIKISKLSLPEISKTIIIPMGIELPELQSVYQPVPKNFFRIAVPANMLPVKGHTYLIEALSHIKKEGVINFECMFFGDGPLENVLKLKVSALGLSDMVIFAGRVDHDELLTRYKNKEIDIVVLPSINTEDGQHEGIPVCLIEAMGHGIPVISTNTGSIPELIENDQGFIVPEKNSQSIAFALKTIACGGRDLSRMSQNARLKVFSDFSIVSVCEQLLIAIRTNFSEKS